jgi:transcriptional regulator with XRE-family HTH domain
MAIIMELDAKKIGARIKLRRKELNLTQLTIKEKVGISSGNLSDIERGNRLPAAQTLVQLAKVLKCSVDYILTGESEDHMDIDIKTVGQRIKERRKNLKITGAQIKEMTGISTGNLSDIEHGKSLPSALSLTQLSKVLNCSVDWILTGEPKITNGVNNILTNKDYTLINYFHEMTVDDQDELLMIAQIKAYKKKPGKIELSLSSDSGVSIETVPCINSSNLG